MIKTEYKLFEIILALESKGIDICSRNVHEKNSSVANVWTISVNLIRLCDKGYIVDIGKTEKWPAPKYETTDKGRLLHSMIKSGLKISKSQVEGIIEYAGSEEGSKYMQIFTAVKT